MRVLLDECVPQRLRSELPGHEVSTVQEMGWGALSNGELLRLAEKQFDAFITVDQSLEYQQNVQGFGIAVLVLVAPNEIDALRQLMPAAQKLLSQAPRGAVTRVT